MSSSGMIIGIDPGQGGAVAYLMNQGAPLLSDTADSPAAMARMLSDAARIEHAYIESCHSMPKQGVASSFKFGLNCGLWLGILGALQIPYTPVTPQVWKRHFNLLGKGKDAARLRAIQLFPALATELKRKKDCGRADALLIAMWGRTKEFGK